MEQTAQYAKARRNLIVFVGLLALSLWVGIAEQENGTSAFLGLGLERPEAIPHVFAIVVVYLLYDFGIQWVTQDQTFRGLEIRRRDFFIQGTISLIVLLVYAWEKLMPPFAFQVSYLVVAAFILLLAGSISWGLTVWFAYIGRSKISEIERINDNLEKRLIDTSWVLHFNPGRDDGRKTIRFNQDGSLENANKNERSWRVRNGYLELLNSEGKVFSRFYYDPKEIRFHHTNDEDTLSLRDQFLYRADVDALREHAPV